MSFFVTKEETELLRKSDTERLRIIEQCYKRNEIMPLEDGYQYFWIENRGALSAHTLRVIADELDQRNREWDQRVRQDLNGPSHE